MFVCDQTLGDSLTLEWIVEPFMVNSTSFLTAEKLALVDKAKDSRSSERLGFDPSSTYITGWNVLTYICWSIMIDPYAR